MLARIRRHASTVAATLLVSVVTLGGSLAAPHPDVCHDAGCAPIVVEHDASAHQMRGSAEKAESHPLHCLVCHWARSFRPRTEARILAAPATQAGDRIHVDIITPPTAITVAQPPLRSPPPSA